MLNKMFGSLEVKAEGGEREFVAYGNVKNTIDKANDVAVDGCYKRAIERHKAAGTAPKLLWSHDPHALPVGKIMQIEEDSTGLLFQGKMASTQMGNDIYELMKDGALTDFSIGYYVVKEEWNKEKQYNELHDIDVREISFVNFPCNEHSILQDVKSEGRLPTKRELERILRECGFSRKEATTVASFYDPDKKEQILNDRIKSSILFR